MTRTTLLLGLLLMTTTAFAAAPSTQPTGASLAFTSDDPITKQALSLMNDGKFAEAQSLLATDEGHADPEVARAREEMKEVIRRTRRDYSVSAADMLKKIQRSISDATAADVERWRKEGVLQYRMVDGNVAYFRREPVNLFRFSDDAKQRREKAGNTPKPQKFALEQHLKQVIADAEKSGNVEVQPIRHRVKFSATVAPNAPGAKLGSLVRCWLPFPQEYRQQRDVTLIRSSPAAAFRRPTAAGENAHHRHATANRVRRAARHRSVEADDVRDRVRVHVQRVLPEDRRGAGATDAEDR
jgi:hypothetical protein